MLKKKNFPGKGRKGLEGSNSENGLKWTIRKKLITLFLLAGLVPLLTYAFISMNQVNTEIRAISKSRLISLRDQKKQQIENYFKTIQNQILTFSENIMVVDAMKGFSSAWEQVLPEVGSTYGNSQASKLRERYSYQAKNTHGAATNSLNEWFPRNKTSQVLQSLYISENNNPIGEKHRLDYSRDGSTYSRVHSKYHPIVRDYLEKFGYYDIFLVDAKTGRIVYTVFKEVDYTTSLYDGPYANSGIGRAFKASVNADSKNYSFIDDFEPYEPSYNAAASFISSPIYDGGEKIGVLIFQAPVDNINSIMTSDNAWKKVGLGDSGEVYMVGTDFKMRNNSRFLIEDATGFFSAIKEVGVSSEVSERIKALETSIGFLEVKTQASQQAVQGTTGFDIVPDYRGVSVLSAFSPVDIMGLKWGIMAEIDEEEAFTVLDSLFKMSTILSSVLIGVLIAFAMYIASWFSKPMLALANRARDIVEGNLKADAMNINTTDELGLLGRSFNTLLERLQDFIMNSERALDGKADKDEQFDQEGDFLKSLEGMRDQSTELYEAKEDLNQKVDSILLVVDAASKGDLTKEITVTGDDAMGKMADSLRTLISDLRESISQINTNAQGLASSSQQLAATSNQMASNAEETAAQANTVSAASEQVSKNVETVATGTEEMGSSIREIARNATESATVVSQAVTLAQETNEMIQGLGQSSNEIGEVIKVITSIAEQTNLLALNATIEAARAGEAGKGFAVVANEVKELANQTAQATENISSKIQDIQKKTGSSVEAIADMTKIIHQIDDISSTIASSVEEQTATTTEISQNVGQAAKGSGDIASNIGGVAEAAQSTAEGASESQKASGELSRMAVELEQIVGRFNI